MNNTNVNCYNYSYNEEGELGEVSLELKLK